MRQLTRDDIQSLSAYEAERPHLRKRIFAIKGVRRVHLGEHLTFLFENTETMRYQVQEMLRIENITDEDAIAHEIETYNELVGDDGHLGCTLLIEIDDEAKRDVLLREWIDLPKHLQLELSDGTHVTPTYDERQVGDDRLSSVQYLTWACGTARPVALACLLPGAEARTNLSAEVVAALSSDLGLE